ncbi:hypothetical protein BJF93_09870 [Xaviernesmea oryzae]|uniref:N-acetyltransferase domain-containing protein n=1 Tax=Xaviernesmea oryzae TaxID=464029 RepID=A0A1Q9AWT1_9HYPH|nr:GNAT family N-acetyltransferase [Xaviernesmea oryzae]OLP59901.1 hypothetical protein BJF93_09870 [Xaviernesmea oryzae]SEK46287.1 Acetyltransferase (GNAT) family protein [Xaviernesmea oryzae]
MIAITAAETDRDYGAAEALLGHFAAWDAAQGGAQGLDPALVLSLFHADEHASALKQKFNNMSATLLLAYDDDALLGCLGIAPFDEHRMELHSVYVDPAGRGQGIGRRLLASALTFAEQHRQTAVLVQTTVYMHAALTLYQSTGFRRVSPFRDIPKAVKATERFFIRKF